MDEKIKKGGISVETEHIFPIIKKWLYSDKDIFLREIVSNACDAVTKLRRLTSLGQVSDIPDDYKITVKADKEERTITVSDNGIGMTEEELDRYLCQIALSGALDFINKYEGEESRNNGIIGHFGLGFYSSFMVSDRVTVVTKSYTGAPAVKWECTDSGEYTLSPSDKETRGTDVIMHIADGEDEYLEDGKLKSILEQYCSFMPVEIYYEGEKKPEPEKKEGEEAKEPEAPKPINDTHPLWMKNPSDCTEEEYLEFYRKVFHDYREPLFHIHINADYPLNFRGILYFPKITNEYESLEGQVKLYYNQVFVADNIKEVIPEFLLMLRGVIDCPELPLNVSRSYLQNSGYVAKMSQHIVKKVADKLNSLFTTERENYEKLWQDIKIFVEYGSLREKKFYDRVKDSVIYQLTGGRYVTLDEYLEGAKEKHENTVYYATDKMAQAQYISMLEGEGIDVMYLDKGLDNQFISMIEQERNVKFLRVDSGVADALRGDGEKFESKALADLFVKVSGNDKLKVTFENLKDGTLPAMLTVSEQDRRFGEMMKLYGMQNDGMPAPEGELVLNSGSDMIKRLAAKAESGDESAADSAGYIYRLALLAQRKLSAEELKDFLRGSFAMLDKLV
ncbi:MAG: molecular chaperone HtpG [Firmicutes bacterium]|uniref:Molecular chaperone HtpG n=1 Tax=Candidatus Colimorpha enterica TaxID=3083063 RepID=A0AAE3FI93_9BACT|nr:molecular chaperone HtpG [Candidatus Colimorpha enterica]MDY2906751.1 molecular chaperone HtpG [Eubacteriales bacterium]